MRLFSIVFVSCSVLACSGGDANIGDGGTEGSTPTDSGTVNDTGPKPDTGSDASTCAGQCVPTPPMGWKFVAYDDKNRNACPNDFQMQTDVVENPQGADATCSCSCSVQTQPKCDVQAATLVFAKDANCGQTGNVYNLTGNTCTTSTLTQSSNGNIYAYGKQATQLTNGSCGAPQTMKNVPPATSQQGRECGLTSIYSSCKTGVCVPDPGGSFGLCVEHDGDQACPTGYTKQHFAGTDLDDTRDCDMCTCTMQAKCDNAVVAMYSLTACGGNATKVTLDGTCQQVGSTAVTFPSYQVTSQASNATCSATNANPIGEVGLKNKRTICCR